MDLVCFRGVGGESEIVVYPGQCTSLLSHAYMYIFQAITHRLPL